MHVLNRVLFPMGLILTAASAQGLESSVHKTSAQSVAAVWRRIGDFCGIASWGPGIAKCELSGDRKDRILTLKDGGTVVEHLVHWSDSMHSYTYRIVRGPVPVSHYRATLRVIPGQSGSIVALTGHYLASGASDADAKKTMDGLYEASLAAIVGP